MRTHVFSILFFCLVACSGNSDKLPDDETGGSALAAFDNFPDSLFFGIYFNEELSDAQQNLAKNGFYLVDSSGVYSYSSDADSMHVILSPAPVVKQLKVVLKSTGCLSASDELRSQFRSRSTTFDESPEFSIYRYELKRTNFTVSYFRQKDFIRLSFEQRSSG